MKNCPVQTAKNEHVVTINFQSNVDDHMSFPFSVIVYLQTH